MSTTYATVACHNCRRRRLKCDRTLPQCLKCVKRAQECLGYQRYFRWERGVASRGKMAGKTFESQETALSRFHGGRHEIALPVSLADPVLQDLEHTSRQYLSYYATIVCKDFVLYDLPGRNAFRDLIPMTQHHPVLLQIIVASAAMHVSNSYQRLLMSNQQTGSIDDVVPAADHLSLSAIKHQHAKSYEYALAAKQKALRLLVMALKHSEAMNIDVILAVVLLFIDIELIESGSDSWQYHLEGARTIIKTFCASEISKQSSMSPLRACLLSNCLVLGIFGSTTAIAPDFNTTSTLADGAMALLRDSEGNHCSSFPVTLLQMVHGASQVIQTNKHEINIPSHAFSKQHQVLKLLREAQSFDPVSWAIGVQVRSPIADVVERTHIATAHRAAVRIYLWRVLLTLDSDIHITQGLEAFVAEVIDHLSCIPKTSLLFTAIAWPAFIAGAETSVELHQKWVANVFEDMWKLEPWGLFRRALGALQRIWENRGMCTLAADAQSLQGSKKVQDNWVAFMRQSGIDWLVL